MTECNVKDTVIQSGDITGSDWDEVSFLQSNPYSAGLDLWLK